MKPVAHLHLVQKSTMLEGRSDAKRGLRSRGVILKPWDSTSLILFEGILYSVYIFF
jgi:hypothetical protein